MTPRQIPGILVVDDHRPTRQALCLLLRDVGYDCRAAASAAEARGVLAAGGAAGELPGLVILDLWMPHEDGESLLAWVRGQAHLGRTRVVVYSAAPEPEHRPRLLAAGADGFLPKPTPIGELLAVVARHARPVAVDVASVAVGG